MMKLKKNLLLALLILPNLYANSQVFLDEGFETGTKPAQWTEEYVSGTEPWRYRNGGHSPNDNNWLVPADEEDITRNPPSAYDGTYNAIFFKQSSANERTKLITKPINLAGAIKPELTFWLCQVPWTFAGATNWDILRVYYKTSSGGSWNLLAEYLDPVSDWTECKINLPNPTSTYYIGFEAQTRWGFGCCIDEVVVEEKGVLNKWVSELKFAQPDLTFVPTGSDNIPIMRIDVKVYGNSGTAIFDSLVVKSMNTSDLDIKPSGVKLFRTSSVSFNATSQLGVSSDFVSGKAAFDNINYDLPTGQSYIWVTYDIRDTAVHGHYLDAKIEAQNLLINDTLYPSNSQSPAGNRIIYETIYHEDFEGTHNWLLQGDFEVDVPDGLGGSLGNADPTIAYNGAKVLGTDLTGLGTNPGDYEPNSIEYYATSPSIDAFYFKNLKLSYRRYLNLEVWDTASIQASVDNGLTWTTIWFVPNNYSDFEWLYNEHNIPSSLSRNSNFKLRFTLGPTDGQDNYSGWNIDDVILTGDYIEKDAAVVEWVYPTTGCGHSASDSVIVKIANLGANDIPANLPVKYSFNGGASWVTNYVTQIIPVGDTIEFTFTTKVNLSQPGLRSSVLAKTSLSGDEASENDQISTQVYIVPTYSLPYSENLESNNGYWRSLVGLWEYGTPAKSTISSAGSGVSSWLTSLSDQYGAELTPDSTVIFDDDFETNKGWSFTGEFEREKPIFVSDTFPWNAYSGDYVIATDLTRLGSIKGMYENGIAEVSAYSATSPAINVSGYISLTVVIQRWLNIVAGDNVKFQVSDDNGSTWVTIWQNSGSAITDSDWTEIIYNIPDSLTSTTQMKLRFILYSDASNVAEGWNIDDFKVYGKLFNTSSFYLQSPCFDLSGIELPIFDTKIFNHTEPNADGATLDYSTNEGINWANIDNSDSHDDYWNWYTDSLVTALGADGWNGEGTGWQRTRHLLPGAIANQDSVVFRYSFMADKLNNEYDGIALDDIMIYEAPFDVGVTSILSPVTSCDLSTEQSISVRIQNHGIRDMQVGDEIIIKVNVDYDGIYGGEDATVTETKTLTGTLAVGATFDYTFTEKFNMSITGTYYVDAMTLIEDDPFFYSASANDTASATIQVQKPYIELGSDYYTVRPDTVELDATNIDPLVDYVWSDENDFTPSLATTATFMVPSIAGGEFFVQLTSELPCVSTDSVTVHRLIADVGVVAYDSPDTSNCELTTTTPFRAWIKNLGTDTLTVGDTLYLGCKFEAEDDRDTLWVMNQNMLPGDSLIFDFDTTLNMSVIGNYDLQAWASVYYDNVSSNDTLSQTINVWGYPTYTLTVPSEVNDTIDVVNYSYQVDADAGNAGGWSAYSWENYPDSTTSTMYTFNTEMIRITVYDIHNCPDTDSVFVNLQFTSIGVDSVLSPLSSCLGSSTALPQFRIKNLGTVAIPGGNTINYGYILNGSTIETLPNTLGAPLAPGESILTSFTTTSDISALGTYEFKFFATMAGDPKVEDDTLFHSVSIYGYPVLELGDDIFTRNLNQLLDGGAGRDSWLWSTTETTQTITVTSSGNYSVEVVEDGICESTDNVNVTFLRHDYSVTQLLGPDTDCSQSALQTVSIRFTNVGNDTLNDGSLVKFGYIVNSEAPVEENYNLLTDLTPGNHIDFSFTEQVDIDSAGTYNLDLYGIYAGDFDTSDDTLSTAIETYALPQVNLGADSVVKSGILTLDALDGGTCSGGCTFEWQDASTNQYFSVNTGGEYWVEATDGNGCQERDTVNIIWVTPDYLVSAIPTPNTSCTLSNTQAVTIKVKNDGTDTLYTDDQIPVKLYIDGAERASENITLTDVFNPNDEIEYTFIQTVDLSAPGAYTIKAETLHLMDLDPINDDFSKSIDVWGLPTVTHPAAGPLCENDSPITLSGGNPSGGIYTGVGVVYSSDTTFNPSLAGAGIKTVTYTYVDGHSCSNFKNIVITVYALPTVTLAAFDPLCENSDPIVLTGGSPLWGVYSGTGVSDGEFDPSITGVGLQQITYTKVDTIYTYSDTLMCSNFDTENINVQALPVVTLTVPSSICIDSDPITLDGGSPAGGNYTGTGVSGTIFNPFSAGVGEHIITYTYTDGTTSCVNTATDTINVYPLPVVNIGSDQTICDGATVTLDAGNVGSTYLWSTTETTQTVDVTTAGTYSVQVTSPQGCESSDQMILTVNLLPSVDLVDFDPVCLNTEAFVLTGGSTNITDSTVVYSGNGVTNGIFDPAVAGVGDHSITYKVTNNVTSCKDSISKILTVNALPVVSFAPLSAVCADADDFELTGGLPSGGNYLGNGVSAGYFFPQLVGAGTYTITYKFTDANSCTDSTTQDMLVNPLPNVNGGNDVTICNTESVTLTATGADTYSWDNGITQGVAFVPVTNTTYTVTGTITATGCQNTDAVNVIVNSLPTVNAGIDYAICLGQSTTLTATGSADDYTWDNGVTQGVSFSPSGTLTYTVTGSIGSTGCVNTDQITVTVNPLPSTDAGTDQSVCEGDDVTLTATGTADSYAWNNGVTQSTPFNPIATNTYIATGTITATGCTSTDQVVVTVNTAVNVDAGNDFEVCEGSNVTLTATGNADTYTWDNEVTQGVEFMVVETKDYIVTGTLGSCQNTDTITITVNPLPTVTLDAFSPVCSGDAQFALSGGSPVGGSYFEGIVPLTTFDPATSGVGTHTITYRYTDAKGCIGTASADIIVKALPSASISTTDPLSYCQGDPVNTQFTALPPSATYQWLLNGSSIASATSQTYTATAAGDYSVEVTENGCLATSSSTTVVVNALPNVTFGALDDVCADESAFALSGGSPANGTYGGIGVTDDDFDPQVAGVGTHTLTYTFTDANTCTNSATSSITVNALPVVDLGNDQTVDVDITLDAGAGFSSYLWQDNSTNQTLVVTETGTYSVSVTDADGCSGYDEINIVRLQQFDVIISQLISPVTSCYESSASPITVRLTNRGTHTYISGESIQVSYRIASGTPVVETLNFTSNFVKDATQDFTFNQGVVLSTGTHSFTLNTIISSVPGEIYNSNVTIHPLPDMEFGEDTISVATAAFPYLLESNNPGPGYLWNNSSTSASITITSHGKYWVRVTDINGCQDSDTVIVHWPTAVEQIPGTNVIISLYPNPAIDELNIEISGDILDVFSIDLYNPQGQIIQKRTTLPVTTYKEKLNIDGYVPGVYFVKVGNTKGFVVLKLLVQKK